MKKLVGNIEYEIFASKEFSKEEFESALNTLIEKNKNIHSGIFNMDLEYIPTRKDYIKHYLKIIGLVVIALLIAYICVAFTKLQLNCFLWEENVRYSYLILSGVFSVALIIITKRFKINIYDIFD